MKRPNVLLLYTDQQRWDTIAAGGNDLIQTPNLDRLAREGALFDHAYVNCPVCMPSRMSMLSGRYPAALGIATNGIEMPEDIECVQTVLKRYDYQTANLGKLHFKNHASFGRDHREPHPHYGFDTLILADEPGCYDDAYIKWVEQHDPEQVPNCRVDSAPAWEGEPIKIHPRATHQPYVFHGPEHLTHTAFVADETVDYLHRHAGDREPFFCISGFYAPHAPLNPPPRFVDMYDPDDMPLPNRNDGENLDDTSDAQWRKTMAYYYALITHVDDQVGRILKALDTLGLAEETLVIFTSDHGENLGDHGLIGKGNWHDSSSRVPLLVRYPEAFAGGQRRGEIVEAIDLVPSILDWCGVQQPPYMQGRSFRPLLEGRDYEPRESAFVEMRTPFRGGYKAVKTTAWTYARKSDGEELLFDRQADPAELTNLAGADEAQPALQEMRHVLLQRWFDVESQYPVRTGHY